MKSRAESGAVIGTAEPHNRTTNEKQSSLSAPEKKIDVVRLGYRLQTTTAVALIVVVFLIGLRDSTLDAASVLD
jgi:hypothetical protein